MAGDVSGRDVCCLSALTVRFMISLHWRDWTNWSNCFAASRLVATCEIRGIWVLAAAYVEGKLALLCSLFNSSDH